MEVYWSGKGPDGGKDLLCIERYKSNFKEFTRRWLVQCKHNAHSGKSVSSNELESIENTCSEFDADGYILICSTFPSSEVVRKLEKIEENKKILTAFWDYKTLELQLLVPQNWHLVNLFFPKSSKELGWQISRIDTNFWHINYKSHIFYFALRLGANCEGVLKDLSIILDEIDCLHLPNYHFLRLRAAYFDEKHTSYMLYFDYLLPNDVKLHKFKLPSEVSKILNSGYINGFIYETDAKLYQYYKYSDHFDVDHRDYYDQYLSDFKCGSERYERIRFRTSISDNYLECTEQIKKQFFDELTATIKKIPFIKLLNASNANVESLVFFSDIFSWEDVIEQTDYKTGNFFDVLFRFECDDFEKLTNLLSQIPVSVTHFIELEHNYIFLPDEGFDEETDNIYTLKISVHPCSAISKLGFRKQLNQYMAEINESILCFLK